MVAFTMPNEVAMRCNTTTTTNRALFEAYGSWRAMCVWNPQTGVMGAMYDTLLSQGRFGLYRRQGWKPRTVYALRVIGGN